MKRYVANADDAVHVDAEEKHVETEPENAGIAWRTFPHEFVEPVRGLLFLGRIEREVEFAGHKFLMHTLTEGEILRIGQLIKGYRETLTEAEAQRLFTLSAAITAVDGEPIYQAINDKYDDIYERASVLKGWYPGVVRALYGEYMSMERVAVEVTNSLKK